MLETLEDRWLPSTLTVTSPANSGAGSLRADIAAANNGDTIKFALPSNSQITLTKGELLLNKNLTITGPGADQLTISGSNKSRVFEVAGGMQVSLSGLTISNGLAQSGDGGGILVDTGAVLTVSNSTLSGNNATYNRKGIGGLGGGIENNGTATVSGCTLSDNSTVNGYGAIYNVSGATLTVENNSAVSGNASTGIANYGSATVSSSTVSNNSSNGIVNHGPGATLTVSSSFVCGNSSQDQGGGIANEDATASITNSTLSDNSSFFYGGGIYSAGNLTVSDSTLSGNSAQPVPISDGGGIDIVSGQATISGCTLSGNSAEYGGGIYNYNGTLTVSGCTLSANTASAAGGGIYISRTNGTGSVTVENGSIISDNTAQYGGGIYDNGTLTLSDSVIGPATVNGVPLPGNSASSAGGGLYIASTGTATVENSSSITGNSAPIGYGADVYNLGVLNWWYLNSPIGVLDGNGTVNKNQ